MTFNRYVPGHFDPANEASPTLGPSSHNGGFRRPWSPIRYDDHISDNRRIYDYLSQDRIPSSILRGQGNSRRQQNASEDSMEALDLADYARTLRRPTTDYNNPYPPFPYISHVHPMSTPTPVHAERHRPSPSGAPLFASYPEYPPSPDHHRPFSVQSRDTFIHPPPSLISGDSSHETYESLNSNHLYASRRPYSLPPFLASTSVDYLPPIISSSSRHQSLDRIASPALDDRDEADISRFPAFSRSWYDDPLKSYASKRTSLPAYTSEVHFSHTGSYKPFPSTNSDRSRDVLPWSSGMADGPPVNNDIKEERIRMLEREFGKEGKTNNEDGVEHAIGSVDETGGLITAGPKKRTFARWAQGILALATAVSALYGALFIKLPLPAPPSSKPPAYALYILSVISFFVTFYVFIVRPCCCGRRKNPAGTGGPSMNGMMVLPVQGLPDGKNKKRKNKKKNGDSGGGGNVQVNLIVDPGAFGGITSRDDDDGTDGGFDDVDGSQASSRKRAGRNQTNRRRGIFQGLAMEAAWREARHFLKRMLLLDMVCLILWAGVFIFVLSGKKCPPGGFNGWCDSYNIATATACLLSLAFGFSVFFDIVDLHKSKASPRTRT